MAHRLAGRAGPLARITPPRCVEDDAVALQDLRSDTARDRLGEGRIGIFVLVGRVLDLPGAVTAGGADLQVIAAITETGAHRRGEVCEGRRTGRQEAEVLRCDGPYSPLAPGLKVGG